jgi:molecular chaperone GrpE
MNRLVVARSAQLLFRQVGRRIGGQSILQHLARPPAPSSSLAHSCWFSSSTANDDNKTTKVAPDKDDDEDDNPIDYPDTSAEKIFEQDDEEDEEDDEAETMEIDRSEVDEAKPGDEGPELVPPREELLQNKLKQLRDQLQRSLAEQENTRRIAHRDIDQARQFAIKSFAKSLLEVSDNLERALDAVPADSIAAKDGAHNAKPSVLANLYQGIQLTEKELRKAFESNGLVKFGDVGEVFDPNKHEALFEYPDAKMQAGTVGQVMKPGFMLNSRVLRPAEVGVVKN